MLLANVIFPAFSAPYFAVGVFPIAAFVALASEIGVMGWRHPSFKWKKASGITLLANLFSWMIGVGISLILPSGLVKKPIIDEQGAPEILTSGPNFQMFVLLAFIVALVLSIAVEYAVWRYYCRDDSKLLASVSIAHLASYVLLVGLIFVTEPVI